MENDPQDTEEPVTGCEMHPGPPDHRCEACVTKHGLKMSTPNLHAMMSPGAIRGRWKKGQPSANPKGRPKKGTLEDVVRELLEEDLVDERSGASMSRKELIGRTLLAKAAAGKDKPLTLLLERIWPKPPTDVNVNASGAVTVIFDDQDRRELGEDGDE